MALRRRRGLVRVVVMLVLIGPVFYARAGECEAAADRAERAWSIPPGLLRAIGIVESGRASRAGGPREAWPFAVGEPTQGRLLDSAAEAVKLVQLRQAAGARNIDVGCFQINLMHHPRAFGALEEAFDPERNADVAAQFLGSLHSRLGSWDAAAAAYHSSTPERGAAYLQRVMVWWSGRGGPGLRFGGGRVLRPAPGWGRGRVAPRFASSRMRGRAC